MCTHLFCIITDHSQPGHHIGTKQNYLQYSYTSKWLRLSHLCSFRSTSVTAYMQRRYDDISTIYTPLTNNKTQTSQMSLVVRIKDVQNFVVPTSVLPKELRRSRLMRMYFNCGIDCITSQLGQGFEYGPRHRQTR